MGPRQGSGRGSLHGGKLCSAGSLSRGGGLCSAGDTAVDSGRRGQPHRAYTLGRVKIHL